MARSMVLHPRQRDAYVHDSDSGTNDARCTEKRGCVDWSRLRLAAAYRRSLETDSEEINADKAHGAILV